MVRGANIKLASMLTGYNIEVFRDIDEVDEEDIYLDEFRDEIDGWVIDQLKKLVALLLKMCCKQAVNGSSGRLTWRRARG